MTIKLSVRTAVWRSQVARVASSVDGLVPVVKGNGYGFGRARLAELSSEFADTVAVGTVHELDEVPASMRCVVLTPSLTPPPLRADGGPILTVGRDEHLEPLADWGGSVIVKMRSTMNRFGTDGLELVDRARESGLDVAGVALHPPLSGTDDDHLAEVIELLGRVDPGLVVWLSHLTPEAYASLPDSHSYRLRLGTGLWHGDKTALELRADVLDVRPVDAGTTAGYRLGEVPTAGHLVMIGAGTANGVSPLADGRSPFHFGRRRMSLHEPPHMHTSMTFVPEGEPCPGVGDWVDLQRPLHMTTVDLIDWR